MPEVIRLPWINKIHVAYKLLFCAGLGMGASFLSSGHYSNTLIHIMLGWDIFCIPVLCFYWFAFFTTSREYINREADKEDPSRVVIFILVLVCTFVSMTAVILLLTAKSGKTSGSDIQLIVALAGMILSWCLVHTLFTVNYAHLFYSGNEKDERGLDFPGEDKPDFLDFAYFSFVIGMTFQVSDVSIASKKIRRWTLLHSLISFAYNTIIVALTINIVAGLSG